MEGNARPKGLGAVRRRRVGGRAATLVEGGRLLAGAPIPWCIRPALDGVDLAEWACSDRARLEALLLEHRALLFRGFGVRDVPGFERFIAASSDGEKLEYRDRTTPRETRGENVYTSTVHPPEERINLHNEGTYWVRWAAKLYFCVLRSPDSGGETPIADVRAVLSRIPAQVRERFERHGMMLVRNFNLGFGLPWQDVFQTPERAEVEAYCEANDISFEWGQRDHLRTSQVRPAIRHHPLTGEAVWFNHAAFFHNTTLEPSMRAALLGEYGEEGLPYDTRYGDGARIEPEVAEVLRAAYEAERVVFPWQAGDVLLLDNMTVAHAREPFVGEREVVVAMTDAVDPALA